ncbi:MAG TPA: NIPSNAP family protein [Terriglobales bacterium]|nr:NIPSNAP family protein [Terriglobales bacterium]
MRDRWMIRVLLLFGFAALTWLNPARPPWSASAHTTGDAMRVLEIRSYNLKPGTRDRFQRRFVEESLPLLRRYKVDVVAYGPSLHDANSWFLMRAYSSIEERQLSEDEFYGSDDWKKGPREAVMADIDTYTTVVLQVDEDTIHALRRLTP